MCCARGRAAGRGLWTYGEPPGGSPQDHSPDDDGFCFDFLDSEQSGVVPGLLSLACCPRPVGPDFCWKRDQPGKTNRHLGPGARASR